MKKSIEKDKKYFDYYLNTLQLIVNLVDTTFVFGEIGRGGGKTEGILGPRSIRVAHDMPRSTVVLAGPTYVSLMQNIVPNMLGYYRSLQPNGRPMLTEGIHYVVGQKDLPKHFIEPIAPVVYPKHTISFCWGTAFQLVSADRPESAAGTNAAHVIAEEMKHIDGRKLRSRVFPTLRGKDNLFDHSQYFKGITGISDTARVDLGEDDWFFEYEKNMNKERIAEIVNAALHINNARLEILKGKDLSKNHKIITRWTKIIYSMRKGQTYYARASSFVNKDILGFDFFTNLFATLDLDEFLTSIATIRQKKVPNMFFGNFTDKNVFRDSYKYDFIQKYDLTDTFQITSKDLKYCNSKKPLYWGFDPGDFMSAVVGQKKTDKREFRLLKNFYVWSPKQHAELAKEFADFFKDHKEKVIYLHYDRAGNKKIYKDGRYGDANDTDAKILKRELERYGWKVILKSLGKRTIYFSEHFRLLNILFGERDKELYKFLIDDNQCEELISSIYSSPVKRTGGAIELDKTTEKTLKHEHQARRSPQLATALMYLIFGEFENVLPSSKPEYPDYDPQTA
ncbi:MAG: hypothetical protein JEY96_01540 [Bacteroidales bacterium]|nr:hypothetical protein [Bacteroidales bacterium]